MDLLEYTSDGALWGWLEAAGWLMAVVATVGAAVAVLLCRRLPPDSAPCYSAQHRQNNAVDGTEGRHAPMPTGQEESGG